ncbi:MAG: NAD(P)/FAD-dependent oxidoreductase [Variibacter sp.]
MGADTVRKHFTVIGAGAVGISAALWLQRDGHAVTLVDRNPPGTGASFGNGGLIQTGAVVPIATPGVLRQVPSMLMDPNGPLVIRWRYLPSLLPYLLRFVASARPSRVEEISIALQAILEHAGEAYRSLLADANGLNLLTTTGELYVYETAASYAAAKTWHDLRRKRGVEVVDLPPEELRQLEPALAPIFHRGVYLPSSLKTATPFAVMTALAENFVANGGEFVQANVQDIVIENDAPVALMTDGGRRKLDQLVVAAGAHSKRWTQQLGSYVPLDTERGYHLMLTDPGIELRVPLISGDYRFAVTPMTDGIRLAGTAELAKVDAPPNYDRAERLLKIAQRVLPGLDGRSRTRWMGQRPSTPDCLPVICRAPRYPSAYLAYGHGHLGLTLGAVTGRLIADMAAGRAPLVDMRPYDVRRFA